MKLARKDRIAPTYAPGAQVPATRPSQVSSGGRWRRRLVTKRRVGGIAEPRAPAFRRTVTRRAVSVTRFPLYGWKLRSAAFEPRIARSFRISCHAVPALLRYHLAAL